MKQHITPEQLMELTPEQQQRLREWWKPAVGDVIYITDTILSVNDKLTMISCINNPFGKSGKENTIRLSCGGWCYKKECLIVLSIGQCIEFLQDEETFAIDRKNELTESFWQVLVNQLLLDNNELIDALWESIKEVL